MGESEYIEHRDPREEHIKLLRKVITDLIISNQAAMEALRKVYGDNNDN